MTPIVAAPGWRYWLQTVLLAAVALPFWTMLGTVALVVLVERYAPSLAGPQVWRLGAGLTGLVATAVTIALVRAEVWRGKHWTLTGDALVRGRDGHLVIPLRDVAAVTLGLPDSKSPLSAPLRALDVLGHGQVGRTRRMRELTPMLRLVDGRLLLLHLSDVPGGLELVEALMRRLADREVAELPMNDAERRRTRSFWFANRPLAS